MNPPTRTKKTAALVASGDGPSRGRFKTETFFAWETIASAMGDGLEDLIAFNWNEVEKRNPDTPSLDIDWPKYAMLERMGQYRAVSVRQNGRLVGYNSYFVQPALRHKHMLWAVNDALFLDADARKGTLGIRLVVESLGLLKALGVQYVLHGDMLAPLNSTTAKPRATFGDLLLRQGFTLLENTYAKRL